MLNPTNSAELYSLLIFSAGIILLALPGLLCSSRKSLRTRWIPPLVLGALLALVGGACAIAGQPSWVCLPPAALAVSLLLTSLLRTPWPQHAVELAFWAAGVPRIQSLVLIAFGTGILVWQAQSLDRQLHHELDETDRHLLAVSAVPNLQPHRHQFLLTDAGNEVPLWEIADEQRESIDLAAMNYLRSMQFEARVIQTAGPDTHYNCHGWVFTGGKGWIKGSDVDRILNDNGYQIVSNPAAGDIAVYRNVQGEVTHTAVVRGFTDHGVLLLESKWGKIGRYIHTADQHAYSTDKCTFYTCDRDDHQAVLVEAD